MKIFKNEKIFTQGTSAPNFSQIQPFLGSPDCPISYRANLGPKRGPWGPKMKIFKK